VRIHLERKVEGRIHRMQVRHPGRLVGQAQDLHAAENGLDVSAGRSRVPARNAVSTLDRDLALDVCAPLEDLLEHRARPLAALPSSISSSSEWVLRIISSLVSILSTFAAWARERTNEGAAPTGDVATAASILGSFPGPCARRRKNPTTQPEIPS